MPGTTSVEFFEQVQIKFPDIIRILLTADDDKNFIIKALNRTQIYAFLMKPVDIKQMIDIIDKAFDYKKLQDANKILQVQLETSNEQLLQLTQILNNELEEKKILIEE